MYETLQSIPITWNADLGTHVEELGKQSNKKWQLTVEHSAVRLAITTLQCGYCKMVISGIRDRQDNKETSV